MLEQSYAVSIILELKLMNMIYNMNGVFLLQGKN